MQEWWGTLDLLSQVLYCIAVPSSLILFIQVVMTIVGFGQSGPGVNPDDLSGFDSFGDSPDFDLDMSGDAGVDSGDLGTGDGGSPGDLGALHLFTLEGIVAFLTVFSWTAILAYQAGTAGTISVLIGAVLGAVAMFGVAKIIQLTSRLASNGTLQMRNALGQTATVYLVIPARGTGQGKVNLTVQERFIEASAITDGAVSIPSGAFVRVVDVRADNVLVVELEEESF
ncbi:MAG: hypothetical protein E7L17_09785 [Clostridium sp.]|uniref:hypothetical protein n=1 Tax=Clostridium sp. TaxID=1506 RepID=UPI00290C2EDB|nr:hypothetical protein [Clostridium sp.]MDU7338389.1 hypothetical protein [Clostridium sp.]